MRSMCKFPLNVHPFGTVPLLSLSDKSFKTVSAKVQDWSTVTH